MKPNAGVLNLAVRLLFIVVKLAAVVVMANQASQKFVYGGF